MQFHGCSEPHEKDELKDVGPFTELNRSLGDIMYKGVVHDRDAFWTGWRESRSGCHLAVF